MAYSGSVGARGGLALAATLVVAAPGAALAGDYLNECSSPDGLYRMFDGSLTMLDDPSGKDIEYRLLRELELRKTEGYCTSSAAEGQQFSFIERLSLKRVAFEEDGYPFEIDMLCLEIGDGLPAAYSCDEQVVTTEFDVTKP